MTGAIIIVYILCFLFDEQQSNKKAGGDKYSALAVFKNRQEADEAFEGLDGEQVKVCCIVIVQDYEKDVIFFLVL